MKLSHPRLCLLALLVLACDSRPESATRPYLHYAIQSAAWLRSVAVHTDSGMAWPDDALRPQEIGVGIGEGVAGKVLFFLALHEATGEEEYLAVARAGADYLLATMPQEFDDLDSFPIGTSVYTGVASVGFTLHEAFKRTGTERYQRGALHAVQLIHDHAATDHEGVWWSVYNDLLFGNAGTGLFLLYAAREFQHDPSRDLAIAAGLKLLSRGIADRGGLTWKFREDRDFLESALAGARYLEAVAKTDSGVFLVPYGWPNAAWNQAFDIGWAHGAAGTARFFYRLWQITDDPRWLERVHQSARGILASGLLDGPAGEDFGEEPFRIDRRFDLGGVVEFFLDLYSVTDTQEYLDAARELVEHIGARAAPDANGIHWPMPRYNFMEDEGLPAEFTGYFYGAAGLGLLMLQLDAVDQGARRPMPLLDNPFVH